MGTKIFAITSAILVIIGRNRSFQFTAQKWNLKKSKKYKKNLKKLKKIDKSHIKIHVM